MSKFHRQLRPGWAKRRAAILRQEPTCRHCAAAGRLRAATEVDHIVPLHLGGGDERANLQPLCADCHKIKTAREQGFSTAAPIDVNGMPLDPQHHWNRKG